MFGGPEEKLLKKDQVSKLIKKRSIIGPGINSIFGCHINPGSVMNYVLMLMLLCLIPSAVTADELLSPGPAYSVNYYDAFGEPDIYASVIGDVEFERGQEQLLTIILSNRGIIFGFSSDTYVDAGGPEHVLSLKELDQEMYRTTVYGIKAQLVSTTEHIEVCSDGVMTLDELYPGDLPDAPFIFKIRISEHAPAGNYILLLPVSYQYQEEVRMNGGSTTVLGLPEQEYDISYRIANRTLKIPILIKPEPIFSITRVQGELLPGEVSRINISYMNTGEVLAEDVVARLVMMDPLSCDRKEVSLGTLGPGQTRTMSFDIATKADALPKMYTVHSEARYTDEKGDTFLSDRLLIELPLRPGEEPLPLVTFYLGLAGFLILFMVVRFVINNRKGCEKDF